MGGTQHSKEFCPEPTAENKGSYIQNKAGLWLFTKTWPVPEGVAVKGNVFVSHGYGEHVLRGGYHYLAQVLNEAGFVVHGLEHQGHGRSNGERVHVARFQDYVDDFKQFIEAKAAENPERPNFLFGHSMGAMIAAVVAIQYEAENRGRLKAVALSALPIMPDAKVDNAVNRGLASVASSISPKWIPPAGGAKLDVNDLSRNKDAVKAYVDDPLIYKGKFRALQAYEMLLITRSIRDNAHKFTYPLLLVHGSEDKIANVQGSHFFHDNCKSADKTFVLLKDFLHEPFEDPEKEKCTGEIARFFTRIFENKPQEKVEVKSEPAAPEAKQESPAPQAVAEVKVEEPKAEQPKAEEPKVEEVKVEAKVEVTAAEPVKEEVKEEIKEEAKEEIKEDIKEEIKEDAKKEEVNEEPKEEKAKEEAKEEVKEEAKEEEAKVEVKEEVKEDAKEEEIKEEVKEEEVKEEEAKVEAKEEEAKEEEAKEEEAKEEVKEEEAKEELKEPEQNEGVSVNDQ